MSPKHRYSQEQNMRRIRERLQELKDALESTTEIQVRDVVLRSGFHPDRAGRAVVAILLERHRAQTPTPFVVEISPSHVVEVAHELGVEPDLEEVAHA